MTGDGLNINGHMLLNDKHRIAGFSFPEFSTNPLTRLSLSGELTPQNVLRVQAKGESYDGRAFFRSLLNAGKIADAEPLPLKDEPGLDLNAEIDSLAGYYDTAVKSVIIDAKRRGGKLTYLEIAGRLNGEAPVAVHVDQRGRDAHAGFRCDRRGRCLPPCRLLPSHARRHHESARQPRRLGRRGQDRHP